MADRKRKNRRQFWTTDEEDRIIEYKMEQVGFSNFGAFARKMLISGLIVNTDMSFFDDVAHDISGATKNINQIAKKVNATGRITQERFTRIKTLGADYTEEALASRIRSKSKPFPFKKSGKERNELIESNAKIESSPGLHNWMIRENLKVIARDFAKVQENYEGIANLSVILDEAMEAMETHRSELRAIEDRMKHLSTLMEYSKTYRELKPAYMEYHKAKDKDKESLHRQHESDILLFESINRQLKEMGYDKVPTFKSLKEEYDSLATRKANLNATY